MGVMITFDLTLSIDTLQPSQLHHPLVMPTSVTESERLLYYPHSFLCLAYLPRCLGQCTGGEFSVARSFSP